QFLDIDSGSFWANSNLLRYYVRTGMMTQAHELARTKQVLGPTGTAVSGLAVCLNDPKATDEVRAKATVNKYLSEPDPEPRYVIAIDTLFCGHPDAALQLLRGAVEGHYCAYGGLQTDPLWAKLRGTPQFAEIVTAAKKCRDDFMAQRGQ